VGGRGRCFRTPTSPTEHSHRDVVRAVAGPGVAEVCGPGSTTALALSLAPRKDRTWPEQNIALRSLWPNSAKRLQSTYFSSDAAQTNTTTIYIAVWRKMPPAIQAPCAPCNHGGAHLFSLVPSSLFNFVKRVPLLDGPVYSHHHISNHGQYRRLNLVFP
jgi:hypothetical protein